MPDDTPKYPYREQWLFELVTILRPRLSELGYGTPDKIQISCGFPSTKALSKKGRRLAECWQPEASKDGTAQILVTPLVDDPLRIADIVVHELGHASGIRGHKGDFKTFMKKLGLEGKATATTAGPELRDYLSKVLERLGAYPHAGLEDLKKQSEAKTQTTRMRKISCATEHEAYILRGSHSTFSKGIPDCPVCGNEMTLEEIEEEEAA